MKKHKITKKFALLKLKLFLSLNVTLNQSRATVTRRNNGKASSTPQSTFMFITDWSKTFWLKDLTWLQCPMCFSITTLLCGWTGRSRGQRPDWPIWWNLVSTKNTKISWVWWHMPVVPATWEADARDLLEPGRLRLQWAETMPLHSSLSDRVRLHLK